MTAPRCAATVRCPLRSKEGECLNRDLILVGHDAHCSRAEETRIQEHEAMLRDVRERESKGVQVLDIWKERDPDRDEDEEEG